MGKRIIMILFISAATVFSLASFRTVHGILMWEEEIAAVSTSNSSPEPQSKRGNPFVRALKAPFRAFGKLFSRGSDKNKVGRVSEKDIKKFETVPVSRIETGTDETASQFPPAPDGSAVEHLETGRALLDKGCVNEAIAELSQAASLNPKLSEAHNLLGVAYDLKGLAERARESFKAALKLDSKNPHILNNLGYLLYRNGDYKGAADRLKKAARVAPQDERILNNLALAQSRLGKFDDAYKNFVRAGGEINGRLNLANRLALGGRSDDARKQYEAARLQAELQNSNPGSQKITVVMEIKDGWVTWALVHNRRPGMGAYEAAALRIARQRRYPAGKNGQELIVVSVHPLPDS